MENEKNKYQLMLQRIQSSIKPIILINACTHGHETVGVKIIEELKKIKLLSGTLIYNIANERAYELNLPFIESDLNRSFPGDQFGTYEQKLAYYINPIIKACDIVVDIHATETTDPGEESAIIVTNLNDETKRIVDTINPPKVLIMEHTKSSALMSEAKIGIGFEYGKNNHEKTASDIVVGIKRMLRLLDMLSFDEDGKPNLATQYFKVIDVMPKDDSITLENLVNYHQVKKGQIIGQKNGQPVYAKEDFVPILFGNNRYKDIFGFIGKML